MTGIGIITYNRPQHLAVCVEQLYQHTTLAYKMHIADDSKDRRGVAFRSNECLSDLRECDHIFLFNDDCFPIRNGWENFFIEAAEASGNRHFLYLKDTSNIRKIATEKGISKYSNSGGCFIYLRKEVIEKVGGFCKDYGFYGFEHAGYSLRIHKAGLTPTGEYLCPEGAGKYIYSLDYDNHLHYNRMLKHAPSLPVAEALQQIVTNQKVFEKDIETIFQSL